MITICKPKQQQMGGWNTYTICLILAVTVLVSAIASAQTLPQQLINTGCTYTLEFWMTHDGVDGPEQIIS